MGTEIVVRMDILLYNKYQKNVPISTWEEVLDGKVCVRLYKAAG